MHFKHRLVGATVVLVACAGVGTATAFAQASPSSQAPKAPVSSPAKVKTAESKTTTDNVQQGDQNTTDVSGAKDTPDPKEAAASSKSATETGGAEDGPGGHADRPGNVDHQFDGQE